MALKESDRPVGGDKAALRTNYLQIIRLEINLRVRVASQQNAGPRLASVVGIRDLKGGTAASPQRL